MMESLTDKLSIFDAPDTVEAPVKPIILTPEQAEQVAMETCHILDEQGWCLWKCHNRDGDVIMIVDQEVPAGAPTGYPVYTMQEIAIMEKITAKSDRLIHFLKGKSCILLSSRKLTNAERRDRKVYYHD